MKNTLTLTVSAIALATSFLSCAPKDEKMLVGGAATTVQTLNIESNKAESAKYLAFALDRAFDGLALVKAVLTPEYAAQQKLTVSADKFETDILDMNTGSYLESKTTGQFAGSLNYAIEKLEKDEDGKVTVLVLKSENSKLETKHFKDSSLKGSFVSSNNMNDRIIVTKGARERSYVLTIEKTEELSLSKNVTAYSNIQAKLEFAWDGSVEMLKEAVKVTAVRINARMHGARTGAITLKDTNASLLVKLDDCVSASGELNIIRDNKVLKGQAPAALPTTLVSLYDSSLTMDNNTSLAQACSSRPRVDLTRFIR